jgi:hypothetical protein
VWARFNHHLEHTFDRQLSIIYTPTSAHPATSRINTMHLLNLTLQPATAVSNAVVGSFSGKGQEILVVHGATRLEILKLNPSTGQCE